MKILWLVALLGATACKKGSGGGTPTTEEADTVAVTCAAAKASTLSDHVTLNGVIAAPPDKHATITPSIAGKITVVRVHEGDSVVKNQEIAVLEDPTLAANAGEAGAAIASARANLDNATAAAARAQRLFDAGISARKDVEDANARKAGAQAELQAARAKAGLAGSQAARAHVRTPIAGTVLRISKRVGEMVDGTAATPIAEVADTSVLELMTDAPAIDLVLLAKGAEVELKLDALPGMVLEGHVVAVAPAVDPTTSLGQVRIGIDAVPAGIQLKIGLSGQAAIKVADRPGTVLIPARALRRSTEGKEEVVVCKTEGADTKAEPREVKVGDRIGSDLEILDGLKPGETIVIDHPLGLEDGSKLSPAGAEGAEPPEKGGKGAAPGKGQGK